MCPPLRNEVAQMSAPDADRLSRRSSCLHEIGETEGGSEASQGEGARRAAERELARLSKPGEQSSNCRLAPRPLISRSKRPQPAGRSELPPLSSAAHFAVEMSPAGRPASRTDWDWETRNTKSNPHPQSTLFERARGWRLCKMRKSP